MGIGESIKKARVSSMLTQKELAMKLGKSERMIQKYENGEATPSVKVIKQIGALLNVTPASLMGWGSDQTETISTLAIRLKTLRKGKGVDQNTVALYLGVDRSTYGKYETGDSRPDNDKLIKLAEYFNVSIDYLLGYNGQPANSVQTEPTPKTVEFKIPKTIALHVDFKNMDVVVRTVSLLAEIYTKTQDDKIREDIRKLFEEFGYSL